MGIFFALLIPVLTLLYLIFYQSKKVTWWEGFLVLAIPTLLIFGIKIMAQHSLMYADEYWNSYVTVAKYLEPWDEEVPCRHPKYRTETYTDSEGHIQTREVFEGYEHLYDVDYHPAEWFMNTTEGEILSIGQGYFEQLCTRWHNRNFRDLSRHYHSIDGNEYNTNWDNAFDTMEPVASIHSYKNKVKHSDSVFQFKKIDPKKTKVLEYNKINSVACNYIYNWGNTADQLLLQRWNAVLGRKKKVVVLVIPYTNQPIATAYDQEAYWKRGNKNEFILCVDRSSSTITWTKVISWTPQTTLKAQVEREVLELGTFNMQNIINLVCTDINNAKGYIRRDFEEFNYISVPVPLWGIILAYIVALGVSIGLAIWSVDNEFENE